MVTVREAREPEAYRDCDSAADRSWNLVLVDVARMRFDNGHAGANRLTPNNRLVANRNAAHVGDRVMFTDGKDSGLHAQFASSLVCGFVSQRVNLRF